MMKKAYKKPMFAAEMFLLNQSIARDCGDNLAKDNAKFNDYINCVWDIGGITLFNERTECNIDVTINQEFGCYNNPTEENRFFRS